MLLNDDKVRLGSSSLVGRSFIFVVFNYEFLFIYYLKIIVKLINTCI